MLTTPPTNFAASCAKTSANGVSGGASARLDVATKRSSIIAPARVGLRRPRNLTRSLLAINLPMTRRPPRWTGRWCFLGARYDMAKSLARLNNCVDTDNRAAPGEILRELFDAALAAADPSQALDRQSPAPVRGRTVVVGAGKASAAMARAFEAAWPGPLE